MNSNELFERSEKIAPGGVHSPVRAFKGVGRTPLFFKEGKGPYIYSVEGGEYVDYCQSFGPLILGHRDPDVSAAIEEIMKKAWTFGTCEPYSLDLAEFIVDALPHIDKVRFVNSGTEAVMSALRVARGATGRNKIIKFEGCYHGHVDSLLVKAGSGLAGLAASDSAGVSDSVASETIVLPLNDRKAVEEAFNKHGKDIAAIISEPMPANFGLMKPDMDFLKFLRKITLENGSLLIFDEVISGFRVAMGGMAELSGADPDLVTYGKVMGGGFPVGCYGGKNKYMEMVAPQGPVYQAGTLSGNPIGMVAGLATLIKVQKEQVISRLAERTETFVNGLREQFQAYEMPFKVAQQASLFWIHGCENENPQTIDEIPPEQAENYTRFYAHCLEEQIYLAPSAFEVSFMSWAHNEKIMVDTMLKFKKVCESYKGSQG
ncbi:MAG: glutamate-1-semialdehyde 2,1-aminomutase [Bdellovibrionales bacterium]|nr:glutamate-1-semialdehyde 2,1-aminomutase [Bdellovibrionales bacterium]NQZ19118.1 glutamate-1-semialdehyde 2,1-aminomutase [Bdellovibrionales bacterium]